MYDEDLVKEIMICTALCVQEMLLDDPNARQEEILEYLDKNGGQIIQETVQAERERRAGSGEAAGEDPY